MRVLVTRGGELAAPGPACGEYSEQGAYTCNCGGWDSLDDGRRLDEVLVADRADITKEQLTAACAARLHADGDDPAEADALAEHIIDIAGDFPIGTPLWAVYDHRNDEWTFVVDERPELRRRIREQPPRFTF